MRKTPAMNKSEGGRGFFPEGIAMSEKKDNKIII